MDAFYQILIDARQEKGLSLAAVAELVGVSRSAVWKWERGDDVPSFDNYRKWAHALGYGLRYEVEGRNG